MTFAEIRESLEPEEGKVYLIYPTGGLYKFFEGLDPQKVLAAFDQCMAAVNSVSFKLTEPKDHPAEILLLQLFQEHARYMGHPE